VDAKTETWSQMPKNILFVCSFNAGRSILAEALVNARTDGRFRAFSAGDAPRQSLHPLTLEALHEKGISTAGLHPKAIEVFSGPDAEPIDFVITLCNNAAGEMCPNLPGQPIIGHWDIIDPAEAPDAKGRKIAFNRAFMQLSNCIANLADSLDGDEPRNLRQVINMAGRGSRDKSAA
jgi:arsenate reductase (thioredoxin)